jgi:6-phosphogluconate dehydrogenase
MKKEIGFIGLGRMGVNMATNLVEKGYRVVGLDPSEEAQQHAAEAGVEIVSDYAALAAALEAPRVVWVMVPSTLVDTVIGELTPLLAQGDTIIDGGNSFFKDSIARHKKLEASGIHFLDCGTSGGMEGARHGASIMVGGRRDIFETHEHIFKALAAPDAYALVGREGAGHFVKMIHNGIEYGIMGAIAEGVSVLHDHEAELGIDLKKVFKPYEHGSIIASKLVTWLRQAYDDGQIELVAGEVPRGETEGEMEYITTIGSVPVLRAAIEQRKATREKESYTGTLIAAMRNQFGGHRVLPKK